MSSCIWHYAFEAMKTYHDTEWGVPVHDDRRMFEHLMMEAMQCGLSWSLMIKKREIFRACFDGFDYDRIAAYTDADVERIMNTEGMIRSRRKIEAVIHNARCFQRIRREHGQEDAFVLGHVGRFNLQKNHSRSDSSKTTAGRKPDLSACKGEVLKKPCNMYCLMIYIASKL